MNNTTGKTLKVIGVLTIILGLFAGLIVWGVYEFEPVGLLWDLVTCVGTFVSGMLFIGFGEVIFLLQENLNANKVTSVQTRVEKNVETDELPEI